ncbi:hypothetical protein A5645_08455 [Mycobacterium asiaticum]|uniref:hypothetical protein n=1 Tax=Mycobacterium asiaticum TaxID=1790 RepID=UPI0007F0288F|nr:hypothetical protein [Mycobacterium asiaticum]OBK96465.1 hypothetical protein A5645_08455 [Mycobacterium asiaticum]
MRHDRLCNGHREELIISNIRVPPVAVYIAVAAGLVLATVILRGQAISEWGLLNPDEAELIVQARAALLSPVPFSTWATGTTGPYWVLFLAGLGALGAPLTLAFAHLLSAVLLALSAAALFVTASRAIGRRAALVATLVWWLPIATTVLVGDAVNFDTLSTEYLPTLLVLASALVPREQLASKPWLFAILGLMAGLAVGAKFQVAPLAAAFVAAQLIVLDTSVRRIFVSLLWWVGGAVLPLTAIVLVMVVSPTTNWALVEQTLTFLGSYGGDRTQLQRFTSTLAALIKPTFYLLVGLGGLAWLGRHSARRSNVARVILILGGFTAVLIGGMGFPHYLIIYFGAVALAATMPVRPNVRLFPQQLSAAALAGVLTLVTAVLVLFGYAVAKSPPLSPENAVAAFSGNSVNRNSALARACPPGSRALVWGWAAELYVAQDWQSTMPYLNVLGLSTSPANRKAAEPIVRTGIDRADCVVDATSIKRPACRSDRLEPRVSYCNLSESSLPRVYPNLAALTEQQFHAVPVTGNCEGCTLYVRNESS